MRAVIYARFSSSGQQETSIDFQVQDCTAFAERNGYVVDKVFADLAKTATTDKRPQFLQCIAYCKTEGVDALIVWKHDRFARNVYHASMYRDDLKRHGVQLLYACESNARGADAILYDAIMDGMSHYFSENLSSNVHAGNRRAGQLHRTLGVKVFGYREDENKQYAIDEQTAPVVRRIFEDVASGVQIKDIIATYLPGWGYTRVEYLIHNEKYYGRYNMYGVDEMCIPPIVSKELWDRANARMARNRHRSRRCEEFYLLSGKVFCGADGDRWNGNSTNKKNGAIYRWYRCAHRGCRMKPIRAEALEKAVVGALWDMLHNEERIKSIVDGYMRFQAEVETRVSPLKESRADLERRRKSLLESIEIKPLPSLVERLEEVENQIKAIDESIEAENAPEFTREEVLEFLRTYQGNNTDEWARTIVNTFLVRVIIYEDKIFIRTTLDESIDGLCTTQIRLPVVLLPNLLGMYIQRGVAKR